MQSLKTIMKNIKLDMRIIISIGCLSKTINFESLDLIVKDNLFRKKMLFYERKGVKRTKHQ